METYLSNFSNEIGAVAALVALSILVVQVTKLIKTIRGKKELDSFAGISFEERLAYVEDKALKLETNHLHDVQNQLNDIKENVRYFQSSCDDFKKQFFELNARVAVLETKIK